MSNYGKYRHLYDYKWSKYSAKFRSMNPKCALCGAPTEVVDHMIPHKGDSDIFWNTKYHQPLCKRCHDSDKAKVENGKVPGKDFVLNNRSDDNGMPESDNHPWNK